MIAMRCAAIVIQNFVRQHISPSSSNLTRTKEEYRRASSFVYDIAATQIQSWYNDRRRSPQACANKIQDRWRRYANRRIFDYYRHLIQFRLVGNPKTLLRAINPAEANMIDRATKVHLRFRLGGSSFPPTLFYKLFLNGSLCDVGSFAPRGNYSNQFKDQSSDAVMSSKVRVGNSYFETVVIGGDDGSWYRRQDRNMWRPIAPQLLQEEFGGERHEEKVGFSSSYFHFSQDVRGRERRERAKKKKEIWRKQQLYRDGKECELIEWSKQLDFEEYLTNWSSLATSGIVDHS